MAVYDIHHTQSSESDLLDIMRYIAMELNEPTIALRMVGAIDSTIETLSNVPQ